MIVVNRYTEMIKLTHELLNKYIEDKIIYAIQHEDLTLYNYSPKCQFDNLWDDVTKQCRGLILDMHNNIIARPFDKFFNIEEHQYKTPISKPIVTKKYDGSLGILYWYKDQPYIATRGSFTSDQSVWATFWLRNKVDTTLFDRSKTYLFEIIYPQNRIIVSYDWEGMVLLAIRDIDTGKYEDIKHIDDNIRLSETYDFTDVKTLQKNEISNEEGYVLFYPDHNLHIKVKFKEYIKLHALIAGISKKRIWYLLSSYDEKTYNKLLEVCPDEYLSELKLYKQQLTDEYNTIHKNVIKLVDEIRKMDSRKEQALYLKSNAPDYLSCVFLYIDLRDYISCIWNMIGRNINEVD